MTFYVSQTWLEERRNESQDENKNVNEDEAQKNARNTHSLEMKLEVLNHFDRDEGASCI
jgi:hypothetical protein